MELKQPLDHSRAFQKAGMFRPAAGVKHSSISCQKPLQDRYTAGIWKMCETVLYTNIYITCISAVYVYIYIYTYMCVYACVGWKQSGMMALWVNFETILSDQNFAIDCPNNPIPLTSLNSLNIEHPLNGPKYVQIPYSTMVSWGCLIFEGWAMGLFWMWPSCGCCMHVIWHAALPDCIASLMTCDIF